MSVGTQARAGRRASLGAAFLGLSFGLGLGATYLLAGLGTATADHFRGVRLADQMRGGLAESMLQRSISGTSATFAVARSHDLLAASDTAVAPAQAWPGRFGARFPLGRRGPDFVQARRDLDCLTEAVYFEARGETPRGQAAVAQVVMNRLASPNFPKTVCAVVFQGATHPGCQFSFACDGSMRRGLEIDAWDRARQVAEQALAGVRTSTIGEATHFHTEDVNPDWAPTMLRVAQVGLHIFYRPNPHAAAIRDDDDGLQRAVFTRVPASPVANLRLTSAVVAKGVDAVLSVGEPAPKAQAASAEQAAAPAAAEAALNVRPAEPATP